MYYTADRFIVPYGPYGTIFAPSPSWGVVKTATYFRTTYHSITYASSFGVYCTLFSLYSIVFFSLRQTRYAWWCSVTIFYNNKIFFDIGTLTVVDNNNYNYYVVKNTVIYYAVNEIQNYKNVLFYTAVGITAIRVSIRHRYTYIIL